MIKIFWKEKNHKRHWTYRQPTMPKELYEYDNSTTIVYKSGTMRGESYPWLPKHYTFKCSFCGAILGEIYTTGKTLKANIYVACPLCGAKFTDVRKMYKD